MSNQSYQRRQYDRTDAQTAAWGERYTAGGFDTDKSAEPFYVRTEADRVDDDVFDVDTETTPKIEPTKKWWQL